MGVNHLGHFLLCNLLIDDMAKAKGELLAREHQSTQTLALIDQARRQPKTSI